METTNENVEQRITTASDHLRQSDKTLGSTSPDKPFDSNNVTLPNTDNLLDISVPKTTLLGKEQAKKRLYAFCASKQSISPVLNKHLKTKSGYSENGETVKKAKKSLFPNAKAKAVIQEIEEIKKVEYAIEQGYIDQRRRSRSRSKESHKRHKKERRRRSNSVDNRRKREKLRYPENWSELAMGGYSQEVLLEMRAKDCNKSSQECVDFRKQFLFQSPSLLLQTTTFKDVKGTDKVVPVQYRRITTAKPKISFSSNDKIGSDCYSRNCLLTYIPVPVKNNVLNIMNSTTYPKDSPSTSKTRRWYPKSILSNLKNVTECTVLENSLGLSILQNYSDGDEVDTEEAQARKKEPSKKKHKQKNKEKTKKKKRSEEKSKSRETKKKKHKKHKKEPSEVKKESIIEVKIEKPSNDKPEKVVEPKVNEVIVEEPHIDLVDVKKEKEDDTPNTDEYYSNWESDEELLNTSAPNTRDVFNESREVNLSWETENDIPLSKSPRRSTPKRCKSPDRRIKFEDLSPIRTYDVDERRGSRRSAGNSPPPQFLEMPFNIRNSRTNYVNDQWNGELEPKRYGLFSDDWEKDDYINIKTEELRLEEERRTLIEERRQLEIEKKKLEEFEQQRLYFHKLEVEDRFRSPEPQLEIEKKKLEEFEQQNLYFHKSEVEDRFQSPEPQLEIEKKKLEEFEQQRLYFHKSEVEDRFRSPKTYKHDNVNRKTDEKRKSNVESVEQPCETKNKPEKQSRKSRWSIIDEIPLPKISNDEVAVEWECNTSADSLKPELLEDEYEKFMEALGNKIAEEEIVVKKNKHKKSQKKTRKHKRAASTSSSSSSSSSSYDSDSSSSSSTSSSSSSSVRRKKNKKKKRKKHVSIKRDKKIGKHPKVVRKEIEIKPVIKIEEVEKGLLENEPSLNKVLDVVPEILLPEPLPVLENKTVPSPVPEHKTVPLPVPEIKTVPLAVLENKTVPLPVPVPSPIIATTLTTDAIINIPGGIVASPVLPLQMNESNDASSDQNVKEERLSTPKRNSILPIKFLTPERRKLATEIEVRTTPTTDSPSKTDNLPLYPLTNRKRHFALSLINISSGSDVLSDSAEDVDFTYKLTKKEDKESHVEEVSTTKIDEIKEERIEPVTANKSEPPRQRKSREHSSRRHEVTKPSPKPKSTSPKRKRPKDDYEMTPKAVPPTKHNLSPTPSSSQSKTECSQKITVVDSSKPSPLSSPLDGFKKSVADSTISDDQLLESSMTKYVESPKRKKIKSPRRMSLDERINHALGIMEEPQPIATTYNNYSYQEDYYDCEQYYENYNERTYKSSKTRKKREDSTVKVVRVGNILQVVPTEDFTETKPQPNTPTEDFSETKPQRKAPIQQNKVTNSTQKILQVGNMLQIVPTTSFPDNYEVETKFSPLDPAPEPEPVFEASPKPISPFNTEVVVKQKAERRAEKDNRRQERQQKRREKENKRKEREKRKHLKVKMQTEDMIKQALVMEESGLTEEQASNEASKPVQWPPIPQVLNNFYKPSARGILCQKAKEEKRERCEKFLDKNKQVKFSDGIRPGEGTSPSGGEELSSPPPAPRKLPKEKRFKKTKIPKKKKVKVKVIRPQTRDELDSEEDNLLPPPPPPGSPPPHIFPSRIKPIVNNIHPNVLNRTMPTPDTSFPPPTVYRPNVPMMIPPHMQQLHPPGPPPSVHHHHLPPPLPPTPQMHLNNYNSPLMVQHGNRR